MCPNSNSLFISQRRFSIDSRGIHRHFRSAPAEVAWSAEQGLAQGQAGMTVQVLGSGRRVLRRGPVLQVDRLVQQTVSVSESAWVKSQ